MTKPTPETFTWSDFHISNSNRMPDGVEYDFGYTPEEDTISLTLPVFGDDKDDDKDDDDKENIAPIPPSNNLYGEVENTYEPVAPNNIYATYEDHDYANLDDIEDTEVIRRFLTELMETDFCPPAPPPSPVFQYRFNLNVQIFV